MTDETAVTKFEVRREGLRWHVVEETTFPAGIGGNFPPPSHRGDLWRCPQCRALWRVGQACKSCDAGYFDHVGTCMVGFAFHRATLGQRLRYWRRR